MDQLIQIINELQDTYAKLDMPFVDLPQIVIIGSQSSGKSSVLENIVRRDFLPRGTGIVTRCPLVLQLIHESDSSKETRARFLHKGDVEYYDFKEIKREIIKQTDVLAGSVKNISDKPITLTIYSADFPNLTLIDLPGLTKVSVESQPKDIEQQIRNICLKFAQQENSIILAVSQGNVDLANSDSLKFAEELDPEGKRTLCVITKLDIMDKGTNAYDILTGEMLRKELGYIGVVSRSQADIDNNKPIEDSLRDEKLFFENNYTDIAHKNGTSFLTQTLNMLLKRHIKNCLPSLRDTIKEKINTANKKLETLGPEKDQKRVLIPKFLNSFNKEYSRIIDGDFDKNLKDIRGGALIADILYKEFPKIIMNIDIESNLTDEMIKATMQNTCGADQMSFSREKPFKSLTREQIVKLDEPSLKCIDDVFETMKVFVYETSQKGELSHFPNLRERIEEETHSLIDSSFGTTQDLVRKLIFSEKTDVMCTHPNYKLGYVIEKMDYRHFSKTDEHNAESESPEKSFPMQMAEFGFKILCEAVKINYPVFCTSLIYFISSAKMIKDVMDVFNNSSVNEERKGHLGPILETIFKGYPAILELKDRIIDYMLKTDSKFYDSLMKYELNYQEKQSAEFKHPVNEEFECAVLKTLVIGYFNMVQENICYYVPKLIKTFLVIHFKENLNSHLQRIYLDPDMDHLLFEDEWTEAERIRTKELLEHLENVKKRIEESFSSTLE